MTDTLQALAVAAIGLAALGWLARRAWQRLNPPASGRPAACGGCSACGGSGCRPVRH